MKPARLYSAYFRLLLAAAFLSEVLFPSIPASAAPVIPAAMPQRAAAEIIVTLESPEFLFEPTANGTVAVSAPDFASCGEPGQPALPCKEFRAAIPPDADLSSLSFEVIDSSSEPISGTFQVEPAPPVAHTDDSTPPTPEEVQPAPVEAQPVVSLLPAGQMRKWKFARLLFNPAVYNPETGELSRVTRAVVVVRYDSIVNAMSAGLLADRVMDEEASRFLMNFDEAASWYQPPEDFIAPAATGDYVIITTNAIVNGSTRLNSFVTSKQNQGYGVRVITESTYDSASGSERADRIRSWLRSNYVSLGTRYVLLIGNPDPDDPTTSDTVGDVPMKMCWPRINETGGDYEAPTDYYYADLTGNWNPDNDTYFCEWSDYTTSGGVDLTPEVYVGRIPVYNNSYTNLDNILLKIMNYENESDTAWRQSALLPMSFSDASTDGAYLAEAMKSGYLNSAGYSSYTMYQQGSAPCGDNSIFDSSQELRGGSSVRARWANNDYGLVLWWGHGNSIGAYVGYGSCGDSPSSVLFDNSQVSYLDNAHPAFVYQNSCTNGYPEDTANLGYSLLRQGAIATISASRVSWYYVGEHTFSNTPSNAGIGYEYARRLVAGDKAGVALYTAKDTLSTSYNYILMNMFDFNLYGDPEVGLNNGGNPIPVLNGISPTSVVAGSGQFTLTASGSNFLNNSVIRWNGSSLTTTFVSSTQLTAVVPANLIAEQGSAAVSVFTPSPGGGSSTAASIIIEDATAGVCSPADELLLDDPISYNNGALGSTDNIDSYPSSSWNESGPELTYTFTAPAPADYQISLTDMTADLDLFVLDGASGACRASNTNIDFGDAGVMITTDQANQIFYVIVDGYNGAVGDYTITATCTNCQPAPVLDSVSPAGVNSGSSSFTLHVFGSDFSTNSRIRWNGSDLTTSYQDDTHLTAAVAAGNITAPGTADITVYTPPPGGGESSPVTFEIVDPTTDLCQPAADLLVNTPDTRRNDSPGSTDQIDTYSISLWDETGPEFAYSFTAPASGDYLASLSGMEADLDVYVLNGAVGSCHGTNAITFDDVEASFSAAAGQRFYLVVDGYGNQVGQYTLTATCTSCPIPPTLSNINPDSAFAGGSSFSLVATGSGFASGAQVLWNGSALTTTFNSSTQLTATIPSANIATGGTAYLSVRNPGSGAVPSNALALSITNPTPALANISPNSAITGTSGFTLTANGSGFVSGSIIFWNGSSLTTTYVSSTQLRAAVPASNISAAGSASVTVYNPAPGGGESSGITFSINNPAPTLSSIAPTSVLTGGSSFTLTANGSNFLSSSVIRWNGTDLTTTYVSAARLTASVPAASIAGAGTANITVFTPSPGGGLTSTLTLSITNPTPTLASLSPAAVTAGSGDFTLTVNGSNFVNGSVVRWNSSSLTTTYVSRAQLTASVPAGSISGSGSATITVLNPTPGGGTSGSLSVTINNPIPTLSAVNPASAVLNGSTLTLTITGTNFVSNSVVRWNSSSLTTTYVSSSQLTASVPAANLTTAGSVNITVSNPAPGGGTSGGQTFSVNNPLPVLTGISPSSATAGSAAISLAVTGSGFVNGAVVRWNGSSLTTTRVSSTQLSAQIPSANLTTAGLVEITVFNPTPGGGESESLIFTINPNMTGICAPAETIDFLESKTGSNNQAGSTDRIDVYALMTWNESGPEYTYTFVAPHDGDFTARLSGMTNDLDIFVIDGSEDTCRAANAVKYGNESATFTAKTGQRFYIVVDGYNGNTGSYTLTLACGDCNPVPVLNELSPSSLLVQAGPAVLEVYGSSFITGSVVRWNGNNLSTTYRDVNHLSAEVPAVYLEEIGQANVTVYNAPRRPPIDGGTSAEIKLSVWGGTPVLNRVTPAAAPRGSAGVTITLTGEKFVENSQARFYAGGAIPLLLETEYISPTELQATVPAAQMVTSNNYYIDVSTPQQTGSSLSANYPFAVQIPEGQACTPAIRLTGAAYDARTTNGVGSSRVPVQYFDYDYFTGPSFTYEFTPTESGLYTAVLQNQPAAVTLVLLDSAADGCNTRNALAVGGSIRFYADAGHTYYLAVEGADGKYGSYKLYLDDTARAPASETQLHSTRPLFTWADIPNSASYILQFSPTPDFRTVSISKTSKLSLFQFTADLPKGKTLYWRVVPVGPRGARGIPTDGWSIKTAAPLAAPSLSAPAANALLRNYNPRLDWSTITVPSTAVFGEYQGELASDPFFYNVVLNFSQPGDRALSYFDLTEELSPNRTYYWHVRTVNGAGDTSAWSTTRSFRTAITPPAQNAPTNGATVTNLYPEFRWGSSEGAVSYTLQVSTSPGFGTLAVNKTIPAASFVPTTALKPARPYYWRVRANGPNGPSDWSGPLFFYTP